MVILNWFITCVEVRQHCKYNLQHKQITTQVFSLTKHENTQTHKHTNTQTQSISPVPKALTQNKQRGLSAYDKQILIKSIHESCEFCKIWLQFGSCQNIYSHPTTSTHLREWKNNNAKNSQLLCTSIKKFHHSNLSLSKHSDSN